jgi:hypothetical protein
MRQSSGPDDLGQRFTGLRLTALQVDPSWYEKYWLEDRAPRPQGVPSRLVSIAVAAVHGAAGRVGRMARRRSDGAAGAGQGEASSLAPLPARR